MSLVVILHEVDVADGRMRGGGGESIPHATSFN